MEAAADSQPQPAGTAEVEDGADASAADEVDAEAPAVQGKVEGAEASPAPEVDTKPVEEEPAAAEADSAPANDVAQDNEAVDIGEAQNN